MTPVSHKSGPLKQKNKKHKGEKKKLEKNLTFTAISKKTKTQNKLQRRLLSKQRRIQRTNELKNNAELRGTSENPIVCTLIPLSASVPVHLAVLLLQTCENSVGTVAEVMEPNLQDVLRLHSQSLNKYFNFITAQHNDLFGCLDLTQFSDWVIFLIPSDISELSLSTYELLTTLYAQGFGNVSFAVLSSSSNLKELRRVIEVRFPIPESAIFPLNTKLNAVNLLRHIALSHSAWSVPKFKAMKHSESTLHSSARFRSSMLVESISMFSNDGVSEPSLEKTAKLCLRGRLRGAPLRLFEPLDQSTTTPVGPSIHLPGWGDFPLSEVKWHDKNFKQYTWSLNDLQTPPNDEPTCMPIQQSEDNMISYEDDNSDVELSSDKSVSSVSMTPEDATMDGVDERSSVVGSDSDNSEFGASSLFSHAARTAASGISSVFSSAQLAKFRAARAEELFPDEVETPPHVQARERFAKYRGLPKFHQSVWNKDKDLVPTHYANLVCFKNYHRNRRTIMRYLNRRTDACVNSSTSNFIRFVPAGVKIELVLNMVPLETAQLIESHHGRVTPSENLNIKLCPRPLVVWSLLPHETRISVCHFTMRRVNTALHAISDMIVVANAANKIAEASNPMLIDPITLGEEAGTQAENEAKQIRDALFKHQASIDKTKRNVVLDAENPYIPPEAEPIKSKELMLFQAGIRRFVSAPIYSTVTNTPHEKAKFEQFFSATHSAITASVYAPVMYSPTNVLQFRIRINEDETGNLSTPYIGELVATGSLKSVDPDRLIIKRIFLSGHPYKVRQRHAVVRYMFFNPQDVQYFQSVQLQTKNGAFGHIKEPVGTHGHMKCVFNRPLSQADVVLMPLYKRIFPKWIYEPQIAMFFENYDKTSSATRFPYHQERSEWIERNDVLQLTKKKCDSKPTLLDETMDPDEAALFV